VALLPTLLFIVSFTMVMFACTREGAGGLSALGVVMGLVAMVSLVVVGVEGRTQDESEPANMSTEL
jgi:hypothetical protein